LLEYALVVGDSWAAAHDWRRTFPERPFLGVRFDGTDVVVLFEPRTATGPLDPAVTLRIRRLFEDTGDAWIDDQVFIYLAPTLRSGRRFVQSVLKTLRAARRNRETG
jgi:hypothetical protein